MGAVPAAEGPMRLRGRYIIRNGWNNKESIGTVRMAGDTRDIRARDARFRNNMKG